MKAFPWGKVPEERGRMRESKQRHTLIRLALA